MATNSDVVVPANRHPWTLHPGNEKYRLYLNEYIPQWTQNKNNRNKKDELIKMVVDRVKISGGNFKKIVKGQATNMTNQEIRTKIAQSFNQRTPE